MISSSDIENSRQHYIKQLLASSIKTENEEELKEAYERLTSITSQGLSNFEERLKYYLDDLKDIGTHEKDAIQALMNRCRYMEDYLMQICKSCWTHKGTDRKAEVFDEQASNYLHQEVLTRVQPDFIEGVNLGGTNIMDQLIQDELMTEDERNSIVKGNTPRRMTEEFLRLMMARLNKKTLSDKFIPAIETDHPIVADKIKELARELQNKNPLLSACAVCNMKEILEVKHLAEHLFSNGNISSDLYEVLRSPRDRNKSKWALLMMEVQSQRFILDTIQSKFPECYERLKVNEDATASLECRCQMIRGHDLSFVDYSNEPDESDVGNNNLEDIESLLDPVETGQTSRPVEGFSASPLETIQQHLQGALLVVQQLKATNLTKRPDVPLMFPHPIFTNTRQVAQQQPVQLNPTFQTNGTNYSVPPVLFTPGRTASVQTRFLWPPAVQPTRQAQAFPQLVTYNQMHSSAPVPSTITTGPQYTLATTAASDRNGIEAISSSMVNEPGAGVSPVTYGAVDFRDTQTNGNMKTNNTMGQYTAHTSASSISEVPITSTSSLNSSLTGHYPSVTSGKVHREDSPISQFDYPNKPQLKPVKIEQPSSVPLTPALLAAELPERQRQMLGEALYPHIEKIYPKQPRKITGMLLELDSAELLHMLESTRSLKAKADEAIAVLEAHQAKEAALSM